MRISFLLLVYHFCCAPKRLVGRTTVSFRPRDKTIPAGYLTLPWLPVSTRTSRGPGQRLGQRLPGTRSPPILGMVQAREPPRTSSLGKRRDLGVQRRERVNR